MDLDYLEAKAKKISTTPFRDPNMYVDADDILRLIRLARMAKDMYAVGEERKFLTTERWDEIKETVKEI